VRTIVVNGITIHDGDMVEGFIEDKPVKGKINLTSAQAAAFFCQNIYCGSNPPDGKKFGYNYSWVFNVYSGKANHGVEITKNLSRPLAKSDSRPSINVPGVGELYHGDYIKVKIADYKPTTLFKCKLVLHDGKAYLNNDKIGSPSVPYGVPKFKYPHLWPFSVTGSGCTNSVTIKELVERAPVPDEALASVSWSVVDPGGYNPPKKFPEPEPKRSTDKVKYSDGYKTGHPAVITEYPSTVKAETPGIRIRHKKVLRLNTDL
jgi:hypothetical protein